MNKIIVACEGQSTLDIRDMVPIQKDLKELTKENYEKLKKQIVDKGFSAPFFIWDNKILDGTQRHRVLTKMREEGWTIPKLPIVKVHAKNEKEAKSKLLSFASQYGKMTSDGLYEFMNDSGLDFNDVSSNFNFAEVDFEKFNEEFYKEEVKGLIDDDEIPESKKTTIRLGDLYQLGNHRLLCGDATKKEDVERLMGGEKADMVFTDPPYGIGEKTKRKTAGRVGLTENHDFEPIIGDNNKDTARKACEIILNIKCEIKIIWGANNFSHSLPELKSWIVWDKRDGVRPDDNADCELAWVNTNKPSRIFRHLWKGACQASEKGSKYIHPTQKPIALAEWCFQNYGDSKNVLDLFLGSGSTLIACEKTNRKCFGMEIDPQYCQVIIDRWEKYTGKKSVKIKNNEKEIIKNEIISRRKKA